MTIDTSREAVEALADELIGDSASAYLENRGAMDELGDRLQLAADTFAALLAERDAAEAERDRAMQACEQIAARLDAALAEVARLSTPPDNAEVAGLVDALTTKSAMINMGEKIAWGSETALMDKAADALTSQAHALVARRKERAMTIRRYHLVTDPWNNAHMSVRDDGDYVLYDDHLATLRREREPVKIKSLVWFHGAKFSGQDHSYAETELGTWGLTAYSGREGRWAYTDATGADSEDDWLTRDECQAAAQADYEARIDKETASAN